MDSILAMIEPQIAIPVIGVVVCAVMVYIFGFQQTQEPSFQHLAVLQSSGKSKAANGVAGKPRNQPAPSPRSAATKAKEKPISNGNATHLSSGKDKENVKPQPQPSTSKMNKKEKNQVIPQIDDAASAGDGDWIQAVSRKDKKTRVTKKEDNKPSPKSSPSHEKADKAKYSPAPASKPRPILEEIALRAKLEQEQEVTKEEVKVEDKKSPKEAKKTVKAEAKAPEIEKVVPKEEPKPKEVQKPVENAKEPSKAPAKEPSSSAGNDAKSNVAFDEVGDLWEEAKSRGAKKKRVRKD